MKSITAGQLRQNPTAMLDDVEHGQTYVITRRSRPVGRVVPMEGDAVMIPPKKQGRSSLASLPRRQLRTASSVDELLEDMDGEW